MGEVVRLFPAPEFGWVHVDLSFDGLHLEVTHESRSGESFALLHRFPHTDREQALTWALSAIRAYGPCRLGRVAL